MEQSKIRNFCIIAHIDHGKSTLADRLLENTGAVAKREMKNQLLDTMDLERERGITIKLQPVRMEYRGFQLNLIDTPGHVDFSYEVSRSLAAVEGALLLVDASQGVQAQTLANLYLALAQDLTIIPIVNKIDLSNADVKKATAEICQLLGCSEKEVILSSGKTGEGIGEILEAIIKLPAPSGHAASTLRALIFDSHFDEYRGVIAHIRVVDGALAAGQQIRMAATKTEVEADIVGVFRPQLEETGVLNTGEIGYVATGLKEVKECRVGDTILAIDGKTAKALPGYQDVKPVVFVGMFVEEGDSYEALRDALGRLKLNDASLQFEPEHSPALGFGFRVGFLGLLHMEVTHERLVREYNIEPVVTAPSVAFRVRKNDSSELVVKNPWQLPNPSSISAILEPWVKLDIITPKNFQGNIMQLVSGRRGEYVNTEYLDERAILHYRLPLASMLTDFYDKLKSVTSGYASMNYDLDDYRASDIVRLDVLVAEEPIESLSMMLHKTEAHERARRVVVELKAVLPRQQFPLKIQAAVGGKILAAERLSALRKDVTAKLYGGDVTRKQKLLAKQKKGKKKMESMAKGKVSIPPEAIMKILKG